MAVQYNEYDVFLESEHGKISVIRTFNNEPQHYSLFSISLIFGFTSGKS
jgi:hypothetical protein